MKPQINFSYKVDGIEGLGERHKDWLLQVAKAFNFSISELNYTFMSDEDLLQINKDYLGHDFYTDIITFDNTIGKVISADIAISYERIKDNATALAVEVGSELNRVMVHGVLHCIGFNDKTETEKQIMRENEDKMLKMFHVEHLKTEDNV